MKILISLISLLLLCNCGSFMDEGFYDVEINYIKDTWPQQMNHEGTTSLAKWRFEQINDSSYEWSLLGSATKHIGKVKGEKLVVHIKQLSEDPEIGEYTLAVVHFWLKPDGDKFKGKGYSIFMPDFYGFREDIEFGGKKYQDILNK